MQLENMMEMYQPRVSEQRQQTYFVVGDLESLSAGALYTKSSGKEVGDDGMTLKFYNYLDLRRFGETELGVQQPGESHDAYKARMKSGEGVILSPPILRGGS